MEPDVTPSFRDYRVSYWALPVGSTLFALISVAILIFGGGPLSGHSEASSPFSAWFVVSSIAFGGWYLLWRRAERILELACVRHRQGGDPPNPAQFLTLVTYGLTLLHAQALFGVLGFLMRGHAVALLGSLLVAAIGTFVSAPRRGWLSAFAFRERSLSEGDERRLTSA